MKICLSNCLILLGLFAPVQSIAQLSSDLAKVASDKALQHYHKVMGDKSGLFNGTKYEGNRFEFKENKHPFYQQNIASEGVIKYDGVIYEDVLLLYDEVLGVLIFQTDTRKIQLVNQKVASFKIGENSFIRYGNNEKGGFYQVLYNGKLKLLRQEVKSIVEDISSPIEGIKRYIKAEQSYYILQENELSLVKKKKDLLVSFKKRKKELVNYMNSQGLSFRKAKAEYLIAVCKFYDQPSQ